MITAFATLLVSQLAPGRSSFISCSDLPPVRPEILTFDELLERAQFIISGDQTMAWDEDDDPITF